MAYGYGGWAPYVPVAERRRKAAQEMEKLRKKGHPVSPVTISGRGIATTFWGKAWCENLESYHDYENRLPRGRTYVRNGSVVDLQIAPLAVTAMVSGSSIYKVSITIAAVPKPQWQSICRDCSGGIDSLVELLQGRLSKAVMERLCRQDRGLFPRPSEIRFKCSCPDSAAMCKHIAAVLYGVGSRLDHQPELLFRLRSVNESDLLPDLHRALPLSKAGPTVGKVLETDDLSALFGLELAGEGEGTDQASVGATGSTAKQPKVRASKAPATATGAGRRRTVAPNVVTAKSGPAASPTPVTAGSKASKAAARDAPKPVALKPGDTQAGAKTPVKANPSRLRPRSEPHDRSTVWNPSDIYDPDE